MGPTLTGSYALSLKVGNYSPLSIGGAQEFLPYSPINAATASDPITSLGTASEPNGTVMVAEGTSTGSLEFADLTIGGGLVYSGTFPLGYSSPVTAVLTSTLEYSPQAASIVAASGPLIFIMNQTSSGVWREQTLRDSTNLQAPPVVDQLALAHYANGYPALIAATDGGQLLVSNFSRFGPSGGWESPLAPLAMVGASCSASIATHQLPGGDNLVASGCGSGVTIFNLSSSGLIELGGTTIPGGASVSSVAFNESGSDLLIGASTGALYSLALPWSGQPTMVTSLGTTPISGLAVDMSSSTDGELAAETQNGSVFCINHYWSNPIVAPIARMQALTLPDTVGFASLLGLESDLYFTDGPELQVARSTATFTSSVLVSDWQSALQFSMITAPVHSDAAGNLLSTVPVSLSVSGGAATTFSPLVVYNKTWVVNVTSSELVHPSSGSTGNNEELPLGIAASAGGELRLVVEVEYSPSPGPATIPSHLWMEFISAIARYGLDVALVAAAAGGGALTVGSLRYRARAHLRRTTVEKNPLSSPAHDPSSGSSS